MHVSCCLKQGLQYSIGRSTKNPLQIKSDKSISRNHVELEVDQSCNVVLRVVGKLTKVSGKSVKAGQHLQFTADEEVLFEMGASPIKATVVKQQSFWKIPHDLSLSQSLSRHLADFDIQVTNSLSSTTSIQIIKDSSKSFSNCLFSLIKNIPILREHFIGDFVTQINDVHADFDSRWDRMVVENAQFPNYKCECRPFTTIHFLVTNRRAFAIFKHIIDAGSGTLWLCDDISNLDHFIKHKITSDNVILLVHLNNGKSSISSTEQSSDLDVQEAKLLKNKAQNLGFRIHDVNDIVGAVLDHNFEKLLERVPVRNLPSKAPTGFPLEEATNKSVIKSADTPKPSNKRKRTNRQVVPLDSLAFFGGGSAAESKQNPTEVPESERGHETSQNTTTEFAEGEPSPKKARIGALRKPDIPNVSEERVKEPVVQTRSKRASERSADTSILVQANPKRSRKTLQASEGHTILENDNNSLNIESGPLPKTKSTSLGNEAAQAQADAVQTREAKRPVSFAQAVKETKSHEVDRLEKDIVNVTSEELTEEAINKLDKLALVETKDLMRADREYAVCGQSGGSEQWAGRKNFKKFVKLWPSRSSRNSPDSATNALRNRAHLITREYVPLRPYEGQNANNQDDSFLKNSQDDLQEEATCPSIPPVSSTTILGVEVDDEPAFLFRSQQEDDAYGPDGGLGQRNQHTSVDKDSNRDQELFVFDEEDSQRDHVDTYTDAVQSRSASGARYQQPEPSISASKNCAPQDSDESDDEPRFQFQSRKR